MLQTPTVHGFYSSSNSVGHSKSLATCEVLNEHRVKDVGPPFFETAGGWRWQEDSRLETELLYQDVLLGSP